MVVALSGAAKTASASPVFETMGSTLGQGGYNGRVTGASAASAYFNPALLPQAEQGLTVGWYFFHDGIRIGLSARDGTQNIPELAVNRFGVVNTPPLPTTWLENGLQGNCMPTPDSPCPPTLQARPRGAGGSSGRTRIYQTVGLVTPLLGKYLTTGVYTMIPYGPFTTGHSFLVDEREQFFTNSLHPELYSDRLDAISLAFGAGSQITDQLSIGVAATLSLANEANAQTYVGNSADVANTLELATDLRVLLGISPHAGITYKPLDTLSLSATVHSPQKMEIETTFGTLLTNGELQIAKKKATHAWLPWTVALGGQWDLLRRSRHQTALVGSVQFARWSRYVNRQSERPLLNYEWSDQISGSLGVRHTYQRWLRSFLDVNYTPSPVPAQSGRTNYVDNDRMGVNVGTEIELPFDSLQVGLRIGVSAQLQVLSKRSQRKFDPTSADLAGDNFPQLVVDEWEDGATVVSTGEVLEESNGLQTNNPGWPGFSSSGVLAGGSVNLTLLY